MPGRNGLSGNTRHHSEVQIDGWRAVTDAVHETGGRIILQLWHVGRISHPDLQPGGTEPVAPSAIQPAGEAMTLSGMKPFVTPRALETAELPRWWRRIAQPPKTPIWPASMGRSARCQRYLLDQFTPDSTNKRDDVYGGSVENRCRLPLEITDAVVDVWAPTGWGRISPFQPTTTSPTQILKPRSLPDHGAGEANLVYLHMVEMGGNEETGDFLSGRNELFAKLRDLWPNTLITNGGYDRAKADAVIGGGLADMVSFGTPYLANPDLAERLHSGAAYNGPIGQRFMAAAPKDIPITHFWATDSRIPSVCDPLPVRREVNRDGAENVSRLGCPRHHSS